MYSSLFTPSLAPVPANAHSRHDGAVAGEVFVELRARYELVLAVGDYCRTTGSCVGGSRRGR
jgi:hypothetical protein